MFHAMELALIVWEDASASAEWKPHGSHGDLATVHSVGWIVHRDDKKLVLHSAVIVGEDSGNEQVIPIVNIIEEKQVIIIGTERCQNDL